MIVLLIFYSERKIYECIILKIQLFRHTRTKFQWSNTISATKIDFDPLISLTAFRSATTAASFRRNLLHQMSFSGRFTFINPEARESTINKAMLLHFSFIFLQTHFQQHGQFLAIGIISTWINFCFLLLGPAYLSLSFSNFTPGLLSLW